MTYQVFLLFEMETEVPLFIGNKTMEDELLVSHYEKLDIFFGKEMDFIIIEKEIPSQYVALKVEEIIYNTISAKFPDIKIFRYKDLLDEQKKYFFQANDLMVEIQKLAASGKIDEMNIKEEEMKILLAKYKRSFKRKFTINQIKKLREKFSGSGNNFFNRKHNDATKKKLGSYLKKKKAIYDKARKKIYQDINAKRKGKTWVEIYGLEKATLIAEKAKATREKNKEKNKKEKPS